MLKKTLSFVLVMAMAITMVMATPADQQAAAISNSKLGYSEGSAVMAEDAVSYYPSAYTVVSLDTEDPESALIKVAFSENESLPASGSAKTGVSLSLQTDGSGKLIGSNNISGKEDALYAVWDISYGGTLDISLGINRKLAGEDNSTTTIGWKATAQTGSATVSSPDNNSDLQTVVIGSHDGSTAAGVKTTGKNKIVIETTETAAEKPADTYSANLYLLVSDES